MPKTQIPASSPAKDLQFLIACCQSEPAENDISFIRGTIQDPNFNLHHTLRLAHRHGIHPLLYKILKELNSAYPSPTITNDILPLLKHQHLAMVRKNMLMSSELIKIMRLFRENGIEALAFKGPVLALQLYGDITLRQYSDLDILIHCKERESAARLLEERGYESLLFMGPKQERVWYRNAKEMSLYHPGKNIHIDLQWQFFDRDYPLHFRLGKIWDTACETSLNGNSIQTFSSDSLLIYLCIHGSKHLWERIGWIKDIDLLVRSGDLNWEQIDREMEGSGFERMFLLGLYMTNTYFRTPLPDSIKEQIREQGWLRKLEDFIVSDWNEKQNMFRNTTAMLYLFPTLESKFKYLTKVIIKPAKNEYRYIDLPENFYWAYYLLRPYLLIRKYMRSTD